MWWYYSLPFIVNVGFGAVIAVLERLYPGRQLPEAPGWYARAFLFNSLSIILISSSGIVFDNYFRSRALFQINAWPLLAQVLVVLMLWTFLMYWWHRAIHMDGLWHIFHQLHHSPSRIEMATTFYKHPAETIVESCMTASLVYFILGASAETGAWLGALVALTGFFSHSNLRTPQWVGYFLQRPEHHSIHHQLDVHAYNYADLIFWDRLFGTFKEAETFTERCGFHGNNEARIGELLRFKDVYR